MEEKKKKERKEKKKEGLFLNLNPNPIKNPRRAKENQKSNIISSSISKGLLEISKEDQQKQRSSTTKIFFKAFQAATSDNKGLSFSCYLSYLFLYRFLVSL